MKAQVGVTVAFRQTMASMQSELEESVLSTQMLKCSVRVSIPVLKMCLYKGIHHLTLGPHPQLTTRLIVSSTKQLITPMENRLAKPRIFFLQ